MMPTIRRLDNYLIFLATTLLTLSAFIVVLNHKGSFSLLITGTILLLTFYRNECKKIFSNTLTLSIITFISYSAIAILWSSDKDIGLDRLTNHTLIWITLPILVYFFSQNKNLAKHIAIGFLIGFKTLVILFALVKFGLLPMHAIEGTLVQTTNYIFVSHQIGLFSLIALYFGLTKFKNKKVAIGTYWISWTLIATTVIFYMEGRMGYASFIIATIFMIMLIFKDKKKMMLIIISIFMLLCAYLYFKSPTMQSRLNYIAHEISRQKNNIVYSGSFGERLGMWHAGVIAWKDSPIIGQGNGANENIVRISRDYNEQLNAFWQSQIKRGQDLHNSYMDILVQLGIVGAVLFVWLFTEISKRLLTLNQTSILGAALLLHFAIANLTASHLWKTIIILTFIFTASFLISQRYQDEDRIPNQ